MLRGEMRMRRVLVAGCGYVGRRLAELLVEEGAEVWGLRRDPSELPEIVRPVAADVTDPATLESLPSGLEAAVYAVSPAGRTEEAYRSAYVTGLRNVLEALDGDDALPDRVVLVTSTGVYGHDDGRWVDEETEPRPPDPTAERMLEGEELASSASGTVLRLGGIYGPGRTRTLRRVLDGEARCPPADRYANRIHRDDAARALVHLLTLDEPETIYLGVDREPAPLREVYRWIAERGGAPDPCRESLSDETAGASGRRGSNKRCSSDRLVASGFAFLHPTFREGYGALMDVADARG